MDYYHIIIPFLRSSQSLTTLYFETHYGEQSHVSGSSKGSILKDTICWFADEFCSCRRSLLASFSSKLVNGSSGFNFANSVTDAFRPDPAAAVCLEMFGKTGTAH